MKLSPIYVAVVVAACSSGMTYCAQDEPERVDQQELFLSSQHPQSKRWAILEDDGTSAWFYITEPNSEKPVADCFVYNRIPPIEPEKLQDYLNGPPPVTTRYAGPAAYQPNPKQEQFEITWAGDGESAAVLMDDKPIAFILRGQKRGYSRNLTADGPFGHPWNQKLFDQLFHPQDPELETELVTNTLLDEIVPAANPGPPADTWARAQVRAEAPQRYMSPLG